MSEHEDLGQSLINSSPAAGTEILQNLLDYLQVQGVRVSSCAEANWFCWIEDHQSVLRNGLLVLAAFVTLALTFWRLRISDMQSRAAQDQAKAALENTATIAEQTRFLVSEKENDLFCRAVDNISASESSKTLSGLILLAKYFSEKHCEDWQVIDLICSYLKDQLSSENSQKNNSANITKSLQIIGMRSILKPQMKLRPDLSRINFRNFNYNNMGKPLNLSQMELLISEFYNCGFKGVNFSYSDFTGSKIAKNLFRDINFSDCRFSGSSIEKSRFDTCYFHNVNFAARFGRPRKVDTDYLKPSQFSDVVFQNSIFSGQTRFDDCTLDQIQFIWCTVETRTYKQLLEAGAQETAFKDCRIVQEVKTHRWG